MKLNKNGKRVRAIVILIAIAIPAIFFSTHHAVVDKDTCRWSIDANDFMCDFHYERNK